MLENVWKEKTLILEDFGGIIAGKRFQKGFTYINGTGTC